MSSLPEDADDAPSKHGPAINPNIRTPNRASSNQRPVEDYAQAIHEGNRAILSQAITLAESSRAEHQDKARRILNACLPYAGDSIRIAITGVPGVGKSTFIETLGTQLVDDGRRLAILAIDPTSERTKGSILGDKTRMGELSRRDDVFIRPSPTSGSLGGVARTTRETILLCEAAGFDTVFVETVGVGQSEVKVHSMVDFFLLLALAGAGDELQGIKRGIVEMADAIAINKADGDNRAAVKRAQAEYQRALQLVPPDTSGRTPPVLTCSALTGEGIDAVWQTIEDFCHRAQSDGSFTQRRQRQAVYWMHQTIEYRLRSDFETDPIVQDAMNEIERRVEAGTLSSFEAAERLLKLYRSSQPSSASQE
jgi:LAO/AO transport system kinase